MKQPPLSPEHQDADDEFDDGPSKSARKRASHALQALGERLVALPADKTATLGLPERLDEAIAHARTIRAHEGRRRQLQFIGRLMRDIDAAPIEAALEAMQHGHKLEVSRQHAAERWRERLLADESSLTELVAQHPSADAQRLRQLRRQALRTPDNPRPRRELYRAVLELLSAEADAAPAAPLTGTGSTSPDDEPGH